MDFSTHTLIEFGLNLAGYIVVALLVYILLRRKDSKPASPAKENVEPADTIVIRKDTPIQPKRQEPEFVSLHARISKPAKPAPRPVATAARLEPESLISANRRENRRAIYREARRLLANGRPHNELLESLPITEDELEMLSVAGKA
ncbi:MAG: hypothetical protein R3F48_13725 [Candidatus Zixiibacteriota bacterium]